MLKEIINNRHLKYVLRDRFILHEFLLYKDAALYGSTLFSTVSEPISKIQNADGLLEYV
jgi:hypothetical protein